MPPPSVMKPTNSNNNSSGSMMKLLPLIGAFILGYIVCAIIMMNFSSSYSSLLFYSSSASRDSDNEGWTGDNDVPKLSPSSFSSASSSQKRFKHVMHTNRHPHAVSVNTDNKIKAEDIAQAFKKQSLSHKNPILGKTNLKSFFEELSSNPKKVETEASLDLFVVLNQASPRSLLGDVEPSTSSKRSSIHLLSANSDAWWPHSLSERIKPLKDMKKYPSASSHHRFSSTGTFSAAPAIQDKYFSSSSSDDKNQQHHCTPHQLVGLLGENVKLNSTVVQFLSSRLFPSVVSSSEKEEKATTTHNNDYGCKVYFTEAVDFGALFSSSADSSSSLSSFVDLYNQHFKTNEKAADILSFISSSKNAGSFFVPFGANIILPKSDFAELAQFVESLLLSSESSSLEKVELPHSVAQLFENNNNNNNEEDRLQKQQRLAFFLSGSGVSPFIDTVDLQRKTASSFFANIAGVGGAAASDGNNNNNNNPKSIAKLHLAISTFFAIKRVKNHFLQNDFEFLPLLETLSTFDSAPHPRVLDQNRINAVADVSSADQRKVIRNIAAAFRLYDEDPSAIDIFPVFSTMCVGVDCMVAEDHFSSLKGVGVGYFIFVLNARDPGIHKRYGIYRQAFPGRFILRDPGRKLACAESWNVILKIVFEQLSIPVPFVVIVNADFITTHGRHRIWNSWMRENDGEKLLRYPMVQYHHFYTFAYTQFGWNVLGTFDENVFPAYGEDVEMVYRSVSLNLYPYPEYPDWAAHHRHVGSMSLKDGEVSQQVGRFDRCDYNMRKWHIHLYSTGGQWMAGSVFKKHKPYSHPWNLKHVPHRNGWILDADHRRCVLTGKGKRISNSGQMCWFNVTKVLDAFPDPAGRPASSLFSAKQLGFGPS